jgi:hypothetical protein
MAPGATRQAEPQPERRVASLQEMCITITELRERATKVEVAARAVQGRILGAKPADDSPDIAKVSEPSLVGMVNNDAVAIRASLVQIDNSLESISLELGSIGE